MNVNDDTEDEEIAIDFALNDTDDEALEELQEPSGSEPEESPTPSEPDNDAQHFDIALAAEHTYMGEGLSRVGSSAVVEAGQTVVAPGLAAPIIVFPGELVPLRLPRAAADLCLRHPDKLLVLLVPDESNRVLSGYGTLCELVEASSSAEPDGAVCLKARATHRVCVRARPDKQLHTLRFYDSPRNLQVLVLPEGGASCPLRAACSEEALRLLHAASDSHHLKGGAGRRRALLGHAAAHTAWPRCLYEAYCLPRLRARLAEHFHQRNIAPLPRECVSLSAWACANVSLTYAQRLALLQEDGNLPRIALMLTMLNQKSALLYCATCGAALARRRDEIAMTTAGVHGHYANPGGYTHDVVTVRRGVGLALAGAASEQYSWFPGYSWRVALCAVCRHHKGWRFDAVSPRLVPRRFFALRRNHVTPHAPSPSPSPATPTYQPPGRHRRLTGMDQNGT